MLELLTQPDAWIALVTLTALEIVLGVDNIIFISILAGRLPESQRNRARVVGLALAMGMRIALLLSITWVMRLTAPLFVLFGEEFSGRDLILLAGGLFLLWKSVHEIHNSLEGEGDEHAAPVVATFRMVVVQIAVIDMVFSLDSVITAVGLVDHVEIMVAAIVIAIGVMMFSARAIGEFVERHPTIKMLALAFLVLIGVTLIAEGSGLHIPKGYVYFAMAFSVGVELLNLRVRQRRRRAAPPPVRLRNPAQERLSGGVQPAAGEC